MAPSMSLSVEPSERRAACHRLGSAAPGGYHTTPAIAPRGYVLYPPETAITAPVRADPTLIAGGRWHDSSSSAPPARRCLVAPRLRGSTETETETTRSTPGWSVSCTPACALV